MNRTLLMVPRHALLAASLAVLTPAVAPTVLAQSAGADAALAPRRAAPLAASADALLPGFAPADSITDDQLALRVASLYERQAALLEADAHGDPRYSRLLDDLVADLQLLAQRPGVMYEPRFREVYSSVLTEHERFYGESALDRGDVYIVRAAGVDAVERGFDLGQPLLEHVTLPDLGTFVTVIPMDVNPKVDRYVQFLRNRSGHTSRLLSRADTYFPMVEQILAEEGVPDELKYLAMVESALNPVAQSHAGAAGMWQFIRATGAAYGLRSEREIDDRLDPERATRAAARHLRDLYDRFGDWQLALAGYNCNPAVIARAAARFESRTGRKATFWDIDSAIPRETRAYVPMFIATALVLSNPDAYGLPRPDEAGPQFAFDRIPVEGGTRLSAVARILDVDEAVLRALNPSLRQGRVPDVRVPQMIRIPQGMYAQFAADLDGLAPPEASGARFAAESVRFGNRMHRPITPQERSEALVAVAQHAASRRPIGTPVRRTNPVSTYADQAPVEVLAFQARASREATQETAAQASAEREAIAQARQTRAELEARERALAERERLVAAREQEAARAPEVRLAAATLRPAPPAPKAAETSALPSPEPVAGLVSPSLLAMAQEASEQAARQPEPRRAEPAPEPVAVEAPRSVIRTVSATAERRAATHRVQRNEYLLQIARQYGVTVSQLKDWNGLDSDVVHPGQTLRVSGEGAPATPRRAAAPTNRTVTHTVASGDNLTRIARQYGVTIAQIQEWNRLSGDTIRPGQRLRIETRRARG